MPETGTPRPTLLDRMDVRSFLAIELSTALIALVFVLAFRMPDTDAFKILLGALISVGFTSAISWYFNSSSGSEKKSDELNQRAAKQDDTLAVATSALAVSAPVAVPTATSVTVTNTDPPTATATTAPASPVAPLPQPNSPAV